MARPMTMMLVAALMLPGVTQAEDVVDPNYTTQNLMVFDKQGCVLLQRNFMGWSTPGVRYDKRHTIRAGLDELAAKYGITIADVRLSGLFSYQYSYTPAISTRSHYSATLAGGTPKPPEGIDELRWFTPGDAVAAIASHSQKAPPALAELSRQMLTRRDRIWGGSFYIWQDGETYKSRVTEPFYVLDGDASR